MSKNPYAFGLGIGTRNKKGDWLEVYFPEPILNPGAKACSLFYEFDNQQIIPKADLLKLKEKLEQADSHDYALLSEKLSASTNPVVAVCLKTDAAPKSVPEAYLKLHLLSHRLVKPHSTDLTGLFGTLRNIAWTSDGPIDIEELSEYRLEARSTGRTLSVYSVDKFPQMCDYVVPKGVRIANSARVRLGAYLGEGTTVMHEGFVNFNAGTEGPGMIEGRISAGVKIGAGSDLGGGCSTMGTLSGGGDTVISVGKKCLIGANAGIGIPLGDRCTIEAGLYVTSGTKVTLIKANGSNGDTVKARSLANVPDLLFRRNSQSGGVECLTNQSEVELNADLHSN